MNYTLFYMNCSVGQMNDSFSDMDSRKIHVEFPFSASKNGF